MQNVAHEPTVQPTYLLAEPRLQATCFLHGGRVYVNVSAPYYHGACCRVCGLSFEERYGQIGRDFIHVHHLVPMADIKGEYEVDPIQDLCPVCPNCHAMLHKRVPPFAVDELKQRMAALRRISP